VREDVLMRLGLEDGCNLGERLYLLSRVHPYEHRARAILKRVVSEPLISETLNEEQRAKLEVDPIAFQTWLETIRLKVYGGLGPAMVPKQEHSISLVEMLKSGKEYLRKYFPDVPTTKLSWYVEDARRTASSILGVHRMGPENDAALRWSKMTKVSRHLKIQQGVWSSRKKSLTIQMTPGEATLLNSDRPMPLTW
jgi:hypothetical protein